MRDSEDDKDAACHLRNNYSISQYDINNASNTLQYLSDLYRENCLLGAMFLNAIRPAIQRLGNLISHSVARVRSPARENVNGIVSPIYVGRCKSWLGPPVVNFLDFFCSGIQLNVLLFF